MVRIQPTASTDASKLAASSSPLFLCWRGPAGHRQRGPLMMILRCVWLFGAVEGLAGRCSHHRRVGLRRR